MKGIIMDNLSNEEVADLLASIMIECQNFINSISHPTVKERLFGMNLGMMVNMFFNEHHEIGVLYNRKLKFQNK